MGTKLWAGAAVAAVLLGLSGSALAQGAPQPMPVQMPAAIAEPRDVAYPAPLTLDVDITDSRRGIFQVHETVPVDGAGPVTLLYPRWLPGNHSPSGPIEKVAGLVITANGQPVTWRRDVVDVYAFHVDVPSGARALDVRFQYLSPTSTEQGRITSTPDIVNLQWNTVVLYPAGYFARGIPVSASVTMQDGWQFGCALDVESSSGGTTHFQTVSLDTLVDSPMFAGRYFRRIDLNPGGAVPVHMDLVGDRPDLINPTEAQIRPHRNLIQQEFRLYGSHHYNHYDILLAMSETLGGIGLEHQRSSENATGATYFTEWADSFTSRDLLPHETTHSWDGKYRRPADLWTPNFNVPMRDSLLWVYEGQTQYWGYVLSARSGLWTREQAMQQIARTAATYDARVGGTWRPLEDTTNDPIIAQRRPQGWTSWQRSEDYYSEGLLIWLDADTLIRERTHGAKSLDNFARAFFGVDNGNWEQPHTYTFEDVVATLNSVTPYDWATFLHDRLDRTREHAPLDGVTRGGYRLAFSDERNEFQRTAEKRGESADFLYSLGINVANTNARVNQVVWDSPAFNQGLTIGTNIIAVNGQGYSGEVMRRAITAAKTDSRPIEVLVKNGERYRTVQFDYHGGLRYPRFERVAGTPDRLSQILAPRTHERLLKGVASKARRPRRPASSNAVW